jgi:hypothetical protein
MALRASSSGLTAAISSGRSSINSSARPAQDRKRPRLLARSIQSGSLRRSTSASTTRPVQHNVPSHLSIVARPHEAGPYVPGELIPAPLFGSIPGLPHVEKRICRNLEATMIQDREPTRNPDSEIHLPGFVCFKFQFHITFAETFSTVLVTSGRTQSEHNESAVFREADIGARGRHVALGPEAEVGNSHSISRSAPAGIMGGTSRPISGTAEVERSIRRA